MAGIADQVFFTGCGNVLREQGMAAFLNAWHSANGSIDPATTHAIGRTDPAALSEHWSAHSNNHQRWRRATSNESLHHFSSSPALMTLRA